MSWTEDEGFYFDDDMLEEYSKIDYLNITSIVYQTPKAILFAINKEEGIWIPKSVITDIQLEQGKVYWQSGILLPKRLKIVKLW